MSDAERSAIFWRRQAQEAQHEAYALGAAHARLAAARRRLADARAFDRERTAMMERMAAIMLRDGLI